MGVEDQEPSKVSRRKPRYQYRVVGDAFYVSNDADRAEIERMLNISPELLERLRQTNDVAALKKLLEERAEIVHSIQYAAIDEAERSAREAERAAREAAARAQSLSTPFSAASVGTGLSWLGRVFLTRRVYKTYVEPHIADMQYEVDKALREGRFREARWIVLRGYLYVIGPFLFALWRGVNALRSWIGH